MFNLLAVGCFLRCNIVDLQEEANFDLIVSVLLFKKSFEGRGGRRANNMNMWVVGFRQEIFKVRIRHWGQ